MLVVDDQDDARSLVIGLLQRAEAGWAIAGEAASGEEALGQARRTRPDVVVLDYRMGGIDGLETARRLLDEDPGLVIVLVSGDADPAMEARCAAVGIQAFLAKTELWRLAEVMRPFATGGRGSTGRPRGSDDGAGGDGRRGG